MNQINISSDSSDIEDFLEAVSDNNVQLVNELLLYDPNIFLTIEGKLALHIASSKNFLCIVNILIAHIKDDNINAVDQNGSTALHVAAEGGYLNILNCLLNNGANINAQDNDGYSVFHSACYHGQLEMVNILIDRGMHVNMKDKDGFTAYHVACLNGHMEIVKNLIDRGVVPLLMKKETIYPKLEKPLLYKAVLKKKEPKIRSPKLKRDNVVEYYDIEGLDDVYIYSWDAMGVYDDDDLCNDSVMLLIGCAPPHYLWIGNNVKLVENKLLIKKNEDTDDENVENNDITNKEEKLNIAKDKLDKSLKENNIYIKFASNILQGNITSQWYGKSLLKRKILRIVFSGYETENFWSVFNSGF